MAMAEKYRATIHGNTIEWEGDEPAELQQNSEITVEVLVVAVPRSKRQQLNSKKAVAALERIASRGGVKSIPDPVKWQREIRKDRRLPGR